MSDQGSAGRRVPTVLSIAGSDSGGGAGIQADLKAFAAAGVHGTTAITAITAQNTVGVSAIHGIPGELIVAQVSAVAEDIGVDAVKIGMLGTVETIEAVIVALGKIPSQAPVVLDPVMVAESGATLLEDDAREVLVGKLMPLADVVTPNVPEARVITGLGGEAGLAELVRAVRETGPRAALVTGGHTTAGRDFLEYLEHGEPRLVEIPGEMHADGAAHGSGCTHSSTLAAQLALGLPLPEAAAVARARAGEAVRRGLREIGTGAGPVDIIGLADRD